MSRHRMAISASGDYPYNWMDIAFEAKRSAGFVCEHCGMLFDDNSIALDHLNANGKPSILTVHHLNGTKRIAGGRTCWYAVRLVICIFRRGGRWAGNCQLVGMARLGG